MKLINSFILFLTFSLHVFILFFSNNSDTDKVEMLLSQNIGKISIKVESLKSSALAKGPDAQQESSNDANLEVLKEQAKMLSPKNPTYPYLSRVNEEEGEIILEIDVDSRGKVIDAQILSSSNFKRLDEEALRFIKSVRFSPATNSDGSAITSRLTKSISFKLNP